MRRRYLSAVVLLTAGIASSSYADNSEPFTVCMLASNPPYSERAGNDGFDMATAQAVARYLGRPMVVNWRNNATVITEIDDGDLPLVRLARGKCDAIFSVPGPAGTTLKGHPSVALGAAYYGAAFEVVACGAGAPRDLSGLKDRAVAIQSQTVAHFALLKLGVKPRNYFSIAKAFAAVVAGEVDAGLLWGPTAGWQLISAAQSSSSAACQLSQQYQPPRALRWNLHVATRKADADLRSGIDKALAELNESGALSESKARWGLPDHPPFSSVYDTGALRELAKNR